MTKEIKLKDVAYWLQHALASQKRQANATKNDQVALIYRNEAKDIQRAIDLLEQNEQTSIEAFIEQQKKKGA